MLSGFAIILENEVLYCSEDSKFTTFEIVIFVQTLIDSINRKHTWRLNNIYFSGEAYGNESMVLKHAIINENQRCYNAGIYSH